MNDEKNMIEEEQEVKKPARKKSAASSKRSGTSTAPKSRSRKKTPVRVLMVGSEALPFAASGGLGDVLGSLPAALKQRLGAGGDVRVVMPLYAQIKAEWREQMQFLCAIRVQLAWRNQYCGIFTLERDGVTWYFLDNEYYFRRETMYGQYDDGERYAFFSMAVLETLRALDWFPNILHAHDWQSALTVVYLKRRYADDPRYAAIRTVYTIHNIEYQGRYDFAILGDVFALGEAERDIVAYDGMINLTKGAIVCCDRLSTVSERYAEELRDAYFAHGLEHIINQYTDKMSGIVNGIDIDYYNAAKDSALPAGYDADNLAGKAVCKEMLQRDLGLEVTPDVPLVAMVTRLAGHKGLDLVCRVLDELMEQPMQFVLLGTGEPEYERFFGEFAGRYPGRAAAVLDFNKPLSKRIYAGADL
ncbi:MAG: glycogen synthase, partial [Clostridia bacterium]|nr:glycogen synthase [Clostridia bacterium]